MPPFRSLIFLLALLCVPAFARAADPAPAADLVVAQDGDLPLILTAPHGGTLPIPGATLRVGKGVSKFVAVTDVRTDELALQIAAGIKQRLGRSPFVVVAKFSRKYADPNRPAADAYESPAAKAMYDTYHDDVRAACAKIIKKWHRGFLIDVHGQANQVATIFRGTNDKATVAHLIKVDGPDALTGAKSLLGQLASRGYMLFPTNDSKGKESAHFDGGYTVHTYGSADGGTFDAVQLEYGTSLRAAGVLPKTADDTAASICVFLKAYLLKG